MIELGFLAGVVVTFLLVAVVVLIMARIGMLRDHKSEAELRARFDAHEKWTREQVEDARAAVLNLTAHLEKLHRKVEAGDNGYHGEEIPGNRELIGAVEGMGQDA